MGHEQKATLFSGLEAREDIARLELSAVKGGQDRGLFSHLGAVAPQFCDKPVSGTPVSLSVGHTRTKLDLTRDIAVSAVGVKGGSSDRSRLGTGLRSLRRRRFPRCAAGSESQQRE